MLLSSFLLIRTNSASQPVSISIEEARTLPKDSTCLANNAATKANVQSQKWLGEDDGFWTSYIYDVPAGTNVDINIATYDTKATIAGSLVYPKEYGSYNFTLTKQSEGWRYTKFDGCK